MDVLNRKYLKVMYLSRVNGGLRSKDSVESVRCGVRSGDHVARQLENN